MSSALTPDHKAAAAQVARALADVTFYPAVKAVVGAVREYESRLSEFVRRGLSGFYSQKEFATRHTVLINELALQAFYDGMKAGGIEDPKDEITDEESAMVDEWLTEQISHIAEFALAVSDAAKAKGEDKQAAQDTIDNRLSFWVRSMETLQTMGEASAQKNMMVTWKYGETEHCETCQNLNGKRRRWKWFTDRGYIPQEPGSDTLDCHGYNCQCQLVNDKGKVVMP